MKKFNMFLIAASVAVASFGFSGIAAADDDFYLRHGNGRCRHESRCEAKISPADAKRIAFNHVGVDAKDVRMESFELDWDDGLLKYELEFDVGFTEYEYDIDAESGKILKAKRDRF
ncbi:MAG: PepSY domain-containing protein [Phascolarctobacterium sp.]|nr:PepSY domain-containing protein [Phascolarctobacterium sp.]